MADYKSMFDKMSLGDLESELAKLEQQENIQISEDDIYKNEAEKNKVDPLFFKAIDQWESAGGNNNAVSPTGVKGRFQMTKGTAKQYGVTDRTNFQDVAQGAGKLVGYLNNKYSGDLSKVLAAYNAGEGVVDEAIERSGKFETSWLDEIENTDALLGVSSQIIKHTNTYGNDINEVKKRKAEEIKSHRENILRLYNKSLVGSFSNKSTEELEQLLAELEGNEVVKSEEQQPEVTSEIPYSKKLGRGMVSAVAGIESAIMDAPGFSVDMLNTLVNKPLDTLIEKLTGKKNFFGEIPSAGAYDIAGKVGDIVPELKPILDPFSSKKLKETQKEYSESGKYQEKGKGIASSLYEKVKRGDIKDAAEYLGLATIENGTQNLAAIVANFIPGLGPSAGLAILGGVSAVQSQQNQIEKEEKGEATADRTASTLNSINQGLLEYAGEASGTLKILDPLRKKFLGIAKEEGLKQANKKVVKPLVSFFKNLISNTGKEVSSELFTQFGQDLSDVLSGVEEKSFTQILSNMADAGVLAISTTGPMTTLSSAVETKDAIKSQKIENEQSIETSQQELLKENTQDNNKTDIDTVLERYTNPEATIEDKEYIIENISDFVSEENIDEALLKLTEIEKSEETIDDELVDDTEEQTQQPIINDVIDQTAEQTDATVNEEPNVGTFTEQQKELSQSPIQEPTPLVTDKQGQDRRIDAIQRKKVDEMSPEEMKIALMFDPLTNTYNRRAYDESEKKKIQVIVDADALKLLNDYAGYSAGDQLLKGMSGSLQETKNDVYRIGGDEVRLQFDTIEEANKTIREAYDFLAKKKIEATLPNGNKVYFDKLGFSWGYGELKNGNLEKAHQEANERLHQNKRERKEQGLRSDRGKLPKGFSEFTPEGKQIEISIVKENISKKLKLVIDDYIEDGGKIEELPSAYQDIYNEKEEGISDIIKDKGEVINTTQPSPSLENIQDTETIKNSDVPSVQTVLEEQEVSTASPASTVQEQYFYEDGHKARYKSKQFDLDGKVVYVGEYVEGAKKGKKAYTYKPPTEVETVPSVQTVTEEQEVSTASPASIKHETKKQDVTKYSFSDLVKLHTEKGSKALKTIASEAGIEVKKGESYQTTIHKYLTKHGSSDDIIDAVELKEKSYNEASSKGKKEAKKERVNKVGDERTDLQKEKASVLKEIEKDGIVELDNNKHDFIINKNKDGSLTFKTQQLNEALEIIENKDGKKFIQVKDKLYKNKKGKVIYESGMDILQDIETSAASDSKEKISDYKEEVKYSDTLSKEDLETDALSNEFDESSIIDIDEGTESNYIEDEDGLDLYRKTKDLLTEKFENKKLTQEQFDTGLNKLNERFSEELISYEKNKLKNIRKATSSNSILKNNINKEQVTKLFKEALKPFTNITTLPKIFVGHSVRYKNGSIVKVLNNKDYGAIYRLKNDDIAIIINPNINKTEVLPTILHELFGHFGASSIINSIDVKLGQYARDLFVKDQDSDLVKRIKQDYKEQIKKEGNEVIFDEWMANVITDVATNYFNNDGTINTDKINSDRPIYKKVIDVINKLVGKIFSKWFKTDATQQEKDDLAKAIIQRFGDIKDPIVKKDRKSTVKNTNKIRNVKNKNKKERMQTYIEDRLSLVVAKNIKDARVRFFDFATKHLYGESASTMRKQIYDQIGKSKKVGDSYYKKAIELVSEFSDWQDANKEFSKAESYINKIFSAGRDNIVRVLDTINTQEALKLKNKISDLINQKIKFEDYQTLKRLFDRVTVPRPQVNKYRIKQTKSGKFVIYNKDTQSTVGDKFNTREEAKLVRDTKYGEKITADVGDKYLRLAINKNPYIITDWKLPNEETLSYKITEEGTKYLDKIKSELTDINGNMFGITDVVQQLNEIKEGYRNISNAIKKVKYNKVDELQSSIDLVKKDIGNITPSFIKRVIKSEPMLNVLNVLKRGKLHAEVLEYITESIGENLNNQVFKRLDSGVKKGLIIRQKVQDLLNERFKKFSYEELAEYTPISRSGLVSSLLNEKNRKTEMVDWKLSSGNTIKLTRSQRISLYMMSKNKEATKHVLGGLYLTEKSTDQKNITEQDYVNLLKDITDKEKHIAQTFFDVYETLANEINQVSNKDIGRDIAGVEFYHPLLVRSQSGEAALDPKNITDLSQLHEFFNQGLPGNLKSRKNSGSPIVLEGVFESFGRVMPLAESYVGLYLTSKQVDGIITSVKDDMTNKGLEEEYKIIKTYVEKLSKPQTFRYRGESIVHFFDSLFIKATLGYKVSTAALQWTSIPMYLTQIDDFKTFSKLSGVLLSKNKSNEQYSKIKEKIMKYSPILRERFEGMISAEAGELLKNSIARNMIFENPSKLRKALSGEGMMYPITKMDEWAIIMQWKAAEAETQLTYPQISPDSETFYNRVAERLEEVVRRTQPVYHPVYRPMIANIPVVKSLTYFTSAPYQFLMTSIRGAKKIGKGFKELKNGNTEQGTFLIAKGTFDILLSTVFQAAAYEFNRALFRRLEDKEQEETGKTFRSIIANILNMFPIVGPLVASVVTGYDAEAGGPMATAYKNIGQLMTEIVDGDSDNEALLNKTKKVLSFIVPVKSTEQNINIMTHLYRNIDELWKKVTGE